MAVSKHIGYALVFLVVIALLSIVYYIASSNMLQKSASSVAKVYVPAPPQSSLSNASAQSFISYYNLPNNLFPGAVLNSTSPECHITIFYKWYLQPGISSPSTPTNFSTLNKNAPFAEYMTIGVVDPSFLSSYNQTLSRNGGYCRPSVKSIISNSTFSYKTANFSGSYGYILMFTNLTSNALNLTSTYYIGSKPNLAWYYTALLHKNIQINVGFWGFSGYMNSSQIVKYTNLTLQSLVSQYS